MPGEGESAERFPAAVVAAVLFSIAAAWIAGVVEGVVLASTGAGRSGVEWVYALILYGWFGVIAGVAWGTFLAAFGAVVPPLRRAAPALLLPGALVIPAAVVGLFWLNRWNALPGAMTARGLAVNGGVLLAGTLLFARTGPMSARMAALIGGHGRKGAFRLFFATLLLLVMLTVANLLPGAIGGDESTPPADGPPVIVLLADTLRRDHLQCYGYPKATSPAIDRFARDAIQFVRSSTGGCRTVPSTATLFTGNYPSAHGVMRAENAIRSSMKTLAERFRDGGYRTAAFISNPYLRPGTGFSRGFDHRMPSRLPGLISRRKTALERIAFRLARYDLTPPAKRAIPAALRWLERSSARPPFVYIHLMEPHSPYHPPRPFRLAFLPPGTKKLYHDPPRIPAEHDGKEWLSWAEYDPPGGIDSDRDEVMTALYDGEIRNLDAWLGLFFHQLKETGIYDRAVIVFLSDHGEEFADHGGYFHGRSLYAEMTGMPLILRLPGGRRSGTLSALPLHTVDLLPTLVSLAGIGRSERVQGRDRSGEILDSSPGGAGETAPLHAFLEEPPFLYSLRWDGFKVIEKNVAGRRTMTLFDEAADPGERNDLASVRPDTLALLDSLLERMKANVLQGAGSGEEEEEATAPDPETRRLLKSLGYTD